MEKTLGAGHGSVGLGKDKIYILGMLDKIGILYAFDNNGKLIWKKEYGLEWYENYTGTFSSMLFGHNFCKIIYCAWVREFRLQASRKVFKQIFNLIVIIFNQFGVERFDFEKRKLNVIISRQMIFYNLSWYDYSI